MSGSSSSTKKTIQPILVDGSNELYGGKIYYINIKINGLENPNEVQVNVISSSGSYGEPELSFDTPHEISVGSSNLNDMYLVKYKKRSSSQGTILELFYIDGSFKLDRIWIGLNGKHGWIDKYSKVVEKLKDKTFNDLIKDEIFDQLDDSGDLFQQKTPNFWLLGRQFHPCDKNKDGKVKFEETKAQEYFCDPCQYCPEDKYDDRCKELLYTQIFEVGYALKDLVDCSNLNSTNNTNSRPITINKPKSIDEKTYKEYYKDYYGSLRTVLNSWCYDFGFSWNLKDDVIEFIDINSSISVDINAIKSNFQAKNQLTSYAFESENDSLSVSTIAWYERGGEKRKYNCSKSSMIMLSPVYGNDFLSARNRSAGRDGLAISSNEDIMGAILGAYSPILRNIYWVQNVYGIKNASDAKDYITTLSLPNVTGNTSGDLDFSVDEYTITEMGELKILAVVSGNDKADPNDNNFVKTVKQDGYNEVFKTLTNFEQKRMLENTGFFVIAYVNENKLAQRLSMERELFDFIGKFYIDEHLFRLCGITGNDEFVRNNTNIESPDGSVKIYSKKDGIGTHPFSKYKYFKSGYLGCVVGTGNILPDTRQEIVNPSGFRNEQTAIILERDSKWVPEPNLYYEIYDEHINKTYGNWEWKVVGEPQGIIDTYSPSVINKWVKELEDTITTGGLAGKIKVFRIYPQTGQLNITPAPGASHKGTVLHPTDKSANQTRQMVKRIGGKYSNPPLAFGLLNTYCTKISFTNDNTLGDIHTPPHTFSEQDISNSVTNVDELCMPEGFRPKVYRAFVTQSFNQEITVPKIQTGVNNSVSGDFSSRSFDVITNTVTNDDFQAFSGSGLSYGCVPNVEYLKNIHSAYTGINPSRTGLSSGGYIEIKGLPDIDIFAQIPSGLSEASISLNENGMFTSLKYSTRNIKYISKDLLRFNQFRSSLKQAKS